MPFFSFLLFASTAHAGEIQYGHVEEVHDTELHIQYKGPAGIQNFVCDTLTHDCESHSEDVPVLFPPIDGVTDYPNSSDGRYGITEKNNGDTGVLYTLYDVSDNEAVALTELSYTKETNAYKFPWANDHLVLFGTDGTVTTYSISTQERIAITPNQSEFPLRSLSPHARYLAAYNYTEEAHKVWNTQTGEEYTIPSMTPVYVEFSQNEKYAAFTDDREGYLTVYLADLTNGAEKVRRVFKDDFTVEDYVWFQDKLYAVGNTKENSYNWVLYEYDPVNGNVKIVSEDVSYGDYVRPIGEHALSFLVIEGKNTHVALYQPDTEELDIIRPVEDSPASEDITRAVLKFGDGLEGVLYTPNHQNKKSDLFVWLHGGPKRQTSFGYHSYLSYAVYDELLEKLVESGSYVLKLDYAGSYGHGSEFMDQLVNNLGDVDVEHVVRATREVQKKYDVNDTYIIGNSYGGYLGPKTLVEKQQYFDGAIAINGVFDWFDLLARIPSSPFKVYFDGLADLEDLKVNFDMYEQASVVKDLPELSKKKKLLLVYGENDGTVPTWQTKEFFYQAEMTGSNVSLLKLESEEHIIRQRESLNQMCSFIADNLRLEKLKCD